MTVKLLELVVDVEVVLLEVVVVPMSGPVVTVELDVVVTFVVAAAPLAEENGQALCMQLNESPLTESTAVCESLFATLVNAIVPVNVP